MAGVPERADPQEEDDRPAHAQADIAGYANLAGLVGSMFSAFERSGLSPEAKTKKAQTVVRRLFARAS
ncbi:hypothetical protein U91I_02094 [alpha proteobacterium U9-1i]|nr:hypothetical protein U91I_02094 [alpha proteobacterium U9-1i]